MNEIKPTVELCPEDRARLDKIIEGLAAIGHRPDCSKCAEGLSGTLDLACKCIDEHYKKPDPQAELKAKLAEVAEETTLEDIPKAYSKPGASTPPTTQEKAEQPTEEEIPQAEPAPEVKLTDIQDKIIALAVAGKKDKAREVIRSYGVMKASDLNPELYAEVYARLSALLEG